MGRIFLCLLYQALFAHSAFASRPILFPKDLLVVPPPNTNVESNYKKMRKEKRKLKILEDEFNASKELSDLKEKKLMEENTRDRPNKYLFKIGYLLPKVEAVGDNSDYQTEFTSHFTAFYRLFDNSFLKDISFWTGLRISPFSASGLYKGEPVRLGLNYVGPIIALGRFYQPGQEPRTGAESVDNVILAPLSTMKTGWTVLGGFLLQSRVRSHEVESQRRKIETKPINGFAYCFEFDYYFIYYSSFLVAFTSGFQTGDDKKFQWIGVSLGGIY